MHINHNFNNLSITENKGVLKSVTQSANPFTFAYLALQPNSKEPLYIENPIGLCLVQLLGAMLEEIQVIQLSLLPCDKLRVIDGILKINSLTPFRQVACDMDTLKWLNQDRAYSQKANQTLIKTGKQQPSFFACPTPSDLAVYEQTILLSLLRLNQITYHPLLETNADGSSNEIGKRNLESIKQYGLSPLAYALAGAVEQAVKLRSYIVKYTEDQAKVSQVKIQDNLTLSNNGYIINN